MVPHHHIGRKSPSIAVNHFLNRGNKGISRTKLSKHVGFVVSPIEHMVNGSRVLNPKSSSHHQLIFMGPAITIID
jgi:hypothetical protein